MTQPKRDLVVVTGAGGGIGRAIALRYAGLGADVIVSDIDEAAADATVALIEAAGTGRGYAARLDVTDAAAWESFAAGVRSDHGVPDVLVNNAGVLTSGGFLDHTPGDWEKIIAVNLMGVVHGCTVFGRQMVAAGRRGHIVNIASTAAYLPLRSAPAYSTTKAAVKMLSECLRAELGRSGIGVTAICPTVIKTDIGGAQSIVGVDAETEAQLTALTARAQQRMPAPSPDRVARAVTKAVRRNRAIVPVNPDAWVIWGLSRLSPGLVRALGGSADMRRLMALAERVFGAQPEVRTDGHATAARGARSDG
jgi:NAD(P)-dependent dehydrogenase (short-subunit alcohol dehydrogenase family)